MAADVVSGAAAGAVAGAAAGGVGFLDTRKSGWMGAWARGLKQVGLRASGFRSSACKGF